MAREPIAESNALREIAEELGSSDPLFLDSEVTGGHRICGGAGSADFAAVWLDGDAASTDRSLERHLTRILIYLAAGLGVWHIISAIYL